MSVERAISDVLGPTDVRMVSHHGSNDVEDPAYDLRLASQVVIIPSWAPEHPAPETLDRIFGSARRPAPMVFVTALRERAKAAIGPRLGRITGPPGHVVVRVEPGGRRFWAIVLTSDDESGRLLAVRGPFNPRSVR